jgi:hypothetical protein
VLQDFLRSCGSGTGSTQPREDNWGATLRWPRDTLYPQRLALTWPTSGGRSVGIFRLRTTSHWVFIIITISYMGLYFSCIV